MRSIILIENGAGTDVIPRTGSGEGFVPGTFSSLSFLMKDAKYRNMVTSAKLWPKQNLLPAPNTWSLSKTLCSIFVPSGVRNLSGRKFSGSPQTASSWLTPYMLKNSVVPFLIKYFRNWKSSVASRAAGSGITVEHRRISNTVAVVYGNLV